MIDGSAPVHSVPTLGLLSSGVPRLVYWGMIAYPEALARMVDAQLKRRGGEIRDTIFYLEHEPVVTHGRATPEDHLHRRPHAIPTYGVPRGGQATYHGPGQLVGYPVIDLAVRSGGRSADLHDYLRSLELGVIGFLDRHYGLQAVRRDGYTGVWVSDGGEWRKLAAIGVSVRHWVTAHGFALNVAPDLEAFGLIVPCGNTEDAVTSVAAELERVGRTYIPESMKDLAGYLHTSLCSVLRESGWCREP